MSINDSTDSMMHMDKGRIWRFRVTLVSILERAYRCLSNIVRLVLGTLGIHCAPDHAVAIPKPIDGPIYSGL
jgi:hypothetical protein